MGATPDNWAISDHEGMILALTRSTGSSHVLGAVSMKAACLDHATTFPALPCRPSGLICSWGLPALLVSTFAKLPIVIAARRVPTRLLNPMKSHYMG